MKLYKYKGYSEYLIEELKSKTLWFSKPTDFNDPCDSAMHLLRAGVMESGLVFCIIARP